MRFPRSLTRFLPAFAAAAVFVAVSTLTRVALALRPEASVLGAGELARSFALGLAFDLVAAAYAVTPLLAWLALAPNRLARTRIYRSATLVLFGVACFGALLLAVSEWLFWEEFGARFNFIAVDYLLYTHEVLGNIWESYPVGWVLGALALAAAGLTVLAARTLWRSSAAPLGWRRGLGLVGGAGCAPLRAHGARRQRPEEPVGARLRQRARWQRVLRVLRRQPPQRAQLRALLRDPAAARGARDGAARALAGAVGRPG